MLKKEKEIQEKETYNFHLNSNSLSVSNKIYINNFTNSNIKSFRNISFDENKTSKD